MSTVSGHVVYYIHTWGGGTVVCSGCCSTYVTGLTQRPAETWCAYQQKKVSSLHHRSALCHTTIECMYFPECTYYVACLLHMYVLQHYYAYRNCVCSA